MEGTMRKTIYKIMALTLCMTLVFVSIATTDAYAASKVKNYTQKGNALKTYDWQNPPYVNNADGLTKVKPKKYAHSRGYVGRYAYESRANVFTPVRKKGTHDQFKTNLFLSMWIDNSRTLTNPQSMVLTADNEYLYVVHSVGGLNKGRIVRYSYAELIKRGLNTKAGLAKIRIATYNHAKKLETAEDKEIMKLIKFGPTILIGHGQSLALNY
jgi:hypothetical protein